MAGFRELAELRDLHGDAGARFKAASLRQLVYVRTSDGAEAHVEGPLPDRGVVRFRREANGPLLQVARATFLRNYAPRK